MRADQQQNFATAGRWNAADGLWLAEILRQTALAQGTPRALIPPQNRFDASKSSLDSPQLRIQYKLEYITRIATEVLDMNLDRIRAEVATYAPPNEVEARVKRIQGEYEDRALVYWAIEEMQKRQVTSAIAMYAYGVMGWSFLETGQGKRDREFAQVEGDVEDALDALQEALPLLFPEAEKLREKYVRKNEQLRAIEYLQTGTGALGPKSRTEIPEEHLELTGNGSGAPQREFLNPDWVAEFDQYLINENTGESLLRERDEYGIPTWESIGLEYYLTGEWPKATETDYL
jgi:hypothetical protein